MMTTDTIAAIATPPGVGGIGVIRVSGPDAAKIADHVFRFARRSRIGPISSLNSHTVHYGMIVDPQTDTPIDDVLLTWMRGPHTYTHDDTIEISCHGGPLPLRETMRVLLESGARQAERGEFTLRAFLNGRLDLAQAESVLNVIGARTAESLRLATDDLAGNLSRRLAPATDALVRLLAYLDASADFPDDEIGTSDISTDIHEAIDALDDVIAGSRRGMLYRDGAHLALVGRPNVGKSSLMNALLRYDRSIVTPIAGTTRDVISETMSVNGIPVTLIDTAGIVESEDVVERIGVDRSRQTLATAHGILFVLDGSTAPTPPDLELAQFIASRPPDQQTPIIIVCNKSDLASESQVAVTTLLPTAPVVVISAVAGRGIGELEDAIGSLFGDADTVSPAMISERQQTALVAAHAHLTDAIDAYSSDLPQDLLATSVRAALRSIGQVTGDDIDEAVLTELFSSFCIGK